MNSAARSHLRAVARVPACAMVAAASLVAAAALAAPEAGALAPPAVPVVSRPGPGRLADVEFYSPALRRMADYLVYLPLQYSPSHPLPVFYLLHGMPGGPLAFTDNAHIERKLEALIRRHLATPMILVFPDGRIAGGEQSDSEWANTPAGDYESYVVDVVHDVDHRFATVRSRFDRAIAGLSAGAYGAANIGLHQVQLFGLIQVWSGYFLQTPTGVFAGAGAEQLRYNSPLDYARAMGRKLRAYPLQAFLYTGTDDPDRAQTPPMAAALRADGVDVGYAVYRGGHSWKLWTPRVEQMLIMASQYFDAALRAVPVTATAAPVLPRASSAAAPALPRASSAAAPARQ